MVSLTFILNKEVYRIGKWTSYFRPFINTHNGEKNNKSAGLT